MVNEFEAAGGDLDEFTDDGGAEFLCRLVPKACFNLAVIESINEIDVEEAGRPGGRRDQTGEGAKERKAES